MTITRDELEQAMVNGRAFIHPSEIEPLCKYAASANTIIEIGTGYGACACLMLMSAPRRAHVHSIDPFTGDTHGTWQSSAQQARQHVANAAKALGFSARQWTLHVMTSHDAAVQARDTDLMADLIFVDGDHTYAGVLQDVEDWLPQLRTGGLMLLHDSRRLPGMPEHEFHRGWPGPTRMADELRTDARVELVEEVHSLTVWRKK